MTFPAQCFQAGGALVVLDAAGFTFEQCVEVLFLINETKQFCTLWFKSCFTVHILYKAGKNSVHLDR